MSGIEHRQHGPIRTIGDLTDQQRDHLATVTRDEAKAQAARTEAHNDKVRYTLDDGHTITWPQR